MSVQISVQRLAAGMVASAALAGVGLSTPPAATAAWRVESSPDPGAYGDIFKGVAALGAGDVWAVGDSAAATSNETLVGHRDGGSWSAIASPNPDAHCQDGNIQWTGDALNAVGAVSADDAWAVGHGCYLSTTLAEHWNGASWSIVPSPSPSADGQDTLNGVAALSSANVWAVGQTEAPNGQGQTLVEHWDGAGWSVVPSPSPTGSYNGLNAVAAASADDVWAVGSLIEHWDGTSWSVVPSHATGVLDAVAVVSPDDVWAVGRQSPEGGETLTLVEHWNGTRWRAVSSPNPESGYGTTNELRGVAAVSPSDVWAVGMFQNADTDYHQHRPLVEHFNGRRWRLVAAPSPGKSAELQAVTALPTGRLWAVGLYSNYEINIYDGTYTAPRTLVLAR